MKKFLTKTIIYFLIFVFSTSLLVYVLDKDLKKSEFGSFKEWNDIFNHKINSQVIIQGNSRACFQYDTYILDSILNTNSYNLGLIATPFDMQYARYQAYVKNNPSPKIIVQNIDQLTFLKRFIYDESQYLPYLNDNDLKNQLLKKGFSAYNLYFPFLKYSGRINLINEGILEFIGISSEKSNKYKGFLSYNYKWYGTDIKEIKERGDSLHYTVEPYILALFRDFMSDCAKRNIKPILVYAPMYKDATDITENFGDFILQCQDLAREYNCPFLDYSQDSMCSDTTYFYNTEHLNSV